MPGPLFLLVTLQVLILIAMYNARIFMNVIPMKKIMMNYGKTGLTEIYEL